MKAVLRAWLSIQRLRIAHRLFPDLFVKGWTPNTVAQALQNEKLRREMEALNRDRAELDARHEWNGRDLNAAAPAPPAMAWQSKTAVRRHAGGTPRQD